MAYYQFIIKLINLSKYILERMIFKLYYKNQTHLYNKNLNLKSLFEFSKKAFAGIPKLFSFIYQSSNGEMTYI